MTTEIHRGFPRSGPVIKVELARLSPILTYGLGMLLDSDPGFRVVAGVAGVCGRGPADVLVSGCSELDPHDSASDGWAGASTLVVAHFADSLTVEECFRAGALGYVHQEASLATIVDGVRSVARGCRFVAEASTNDSPAMLQEASSLSPRERQVLTCIAQGRTHYQVARILGISSHTVDTYVKRARAKLRLGNKADLTRAAIFSLNGHGERVRE